jgi:hypothetical protein
MAITLTENRNLLDAADSLTGWTGHDTLITSNPTPIEDTGCVGANVGAEIFVGYHTISSTDLSDAVIYCWVFSRLALGDTLDTNGGLMVMVADATPDRIGYKTNGADIAAFRHDLGPTGWECPALDTTSLPAFYTSAGSEANLDWTAILEVGTIVNSLSAAPGMNPTYQADIMRWLDPTANNGCAITITGGTSGTPGLFSEIATADRQVGNLQAHGIIRQLAAGVTGAQGPIRFGNATGSASSWFEDSNGTFIFEDRGFRTDLYKIFITDNGTGTTTFRLHGYALIAPPGVGAEFDADTDTDVTDVVIDSNSRIEGYIGGVGLQSGHICTDTIIALSGQVRANGATMNGSSVLESTVAADTGSLEWNVATDPDGLLDNMTFEMGAADHHAIDFGTAFDSSLVSVTLTGVNFNGFGAVDDANASTLRFLATTGTLTLNLIDCLVDGAGPVASGGGQNFSIDDAAGMTVTVVIAPVTLLITVTDKADNLPIENVQTSIYLADSPFTELMNEDTTASGIASEQYSGTVPVDIKWRTRKSDELDDPRYFAQSGLGEITTGGFTQAVLMEENTTFPAPPPTSNTISVLVVGGTFTASSGTSLNDTIPLVAGTNRKLLVWGKHSDATFGNSAITLNYDGNACTQIGSTSEYTFANFRMDFEYYDVPDVDSGNKTVNMTIAGARTNRDLFWALLDNAATGAADQSVMNNASIASVSTESTTLTPSAANSLLIHGVETRTGSAFGVGTGDTEELDGLGSEGRQHIVSEYLTVTSSSTITSDWTTNSVYLKGGAVILEA